MDIILNHSIQVKFERLKWQLKQLGIQGDEEVQDNDNKKKDMKDKKND